MLYRKVHIVRDLTASYTKWVPSHEVALLREIWSTTDEDVRVMRGWQLRDRPQMLDIETEAERLRRVYTPSVLYAAYGPMESGLFEAAIKTPRWAYWLQRFQNWLRKPERQMTLDDRPAPQLIIEHSPSETVEFDAGLRKAVFDAIDDAIAASAARDAERKRFQ